MSDRIDWQLNEVMEFFPNRLKEMESIGYDTIIHFDFSDGPKFTLKVENCIAEVFEGLIGSSKCTITTESSLYLDVEKGQKNAMSAILSGQIKVSNMMEMMKMSQHFYGFLSTKI